jgi:FtsH-binding integral membrane protein
VARAAVPPLAGAAYLAALLAVDRQATYPEQLGLGVVTWLVLGLALTRVSPERRAQALAVVVFATVGEVTGSLVWGVYHYRLHNLPLFIPPAHGLVYLTGLSLAVALKRHARALVLTAALAAAGWGLAGLTVLPRLDVAGAVGVPLLLVFLWRGRNRAVYAGVFLVVASLELYGTAIGTWRWARELPGLGIPDGNPPSGVASGYVWFDVMALLTAPAMLAFVRRRAGRTPSGGARPLPNTTPG